MSFDNCGLTYTITRHTMSLAASSNGRRRVKKFFYPWMVMGELVSFLFLEKKFKSFFTDTKFLQRISEERFRKRKYRRNVICMVVEDEQDEPKRVKYNSEGTDDQNQQFNQHQTEDTSVSTKCKKQNKKTNNKNNTKKNKKEEIVGCRPGSKNYNKFIAIQKRANKIINNKAKEKSSINHIDDDTIKTITVCEEKTITMNIDDDTLLDGFSQVTESDFLTPEKPDDNMKSKLFYV